MPPAYPSRSSTALKGAGIETRPLASILFVNVETKRSIPRIRTSSTTPTKIFDVPAPSNRLETHARPTGGAVAVDLIWALSPDRRHATDPYPVRSGIYGIARKFMGVNGLLTISRGITPGI